MKRHVENGSPATSFDGWLSEKLCKESTNATGTSMIVNELLEKASETKIKARANLAGRQAAQTLDFIVNTRRQLTSPAEYSDLVGMALSLRLPRLNCGRDALGF